MDIDVSTGHIRDVVEVIESYKRWREAMRGELEARVRYRNEVKQNISKRLAAEKEHPWPEVIVRDVARMDEYPKPDDSPWGISPWFKVEKRGLYHRGFEVGLRLVEVVVSGKEAREVEHSEGSEVVLIVARIPFDWIVEIDWAGDEYNQQPHFYCWFVSKKKECYESIEVYRKAYRDIDPNFWLHLDGVRFKPIHRSRLKRWRMQRKISKAQRQFEREHSHGPSA